jgi:hypothetical protein
MRSAASSDLLLSAGSPSHSRQDGAGFIFGRYLTSQPRKVNKKWGLSSRRIGESIEMIGHLLCSRQLAGSITYGGRRLIFPKLQYHAPIISSNAGIGSLRRTFGRGDMDCMDKRKRSMCFLRGGTGTEGSGEIGYSRSLAGRKGEVKWYLLKYQM